MQERILQAVTEKIKEGVIPKAVYLGREEAPELFGRSWIHHGGETIFKQWIGHPECDNVDIILTDKESEFRVE